MSVIDAALLVGLLLVVWSVYRAQKDPAFQFDIFDLLMENGRVSKIAVAFMVTLAATTWILLRLTIDGKLTEGYFASYGALWVAPLVAKLFSTPPTTSSITQTSTTTIAEQKP